MNGQEISQNSNNVSTDTTPPELTYQENVALKWTVFALFAASAPFVVFLMPKVAGPIILFGALIFCAVFLFSDQNSNLYKNAINLWKNEHTTKITSLRIDAPSKEEGPNFFFHLEEKFPQLASQNYIVALASEGGKEALTKSIVGQNRTYIDAAKVVLSDEIPDLILVKIKGHRYWCRPWNYQYDYSDEIESFKTSQ